MKKIICMACLCLFITQFSFSQENIYDFQSSITIENLTDNENQKLGVYKDFFEFTEYRIIEKFNPIDFSHNEDVVINNVFTGKSIIVKNKILQLTDEGYKYYADNTFSNSNISGKEDFNSLTIMKTKYGLYGSIATDEVTFIIRPLSNNKQVIFEEKDEGDYQSCGVTHDSTVPSSDNDVNTFSPTNCKIDILAFYSEKALKSLDNSINALKDEIKLSIFESNIVLINSQVNSTITYNLVGILLDKEHIVSEEEEYSNPMDYDLDISIFGKLSNENSNLSKLREDYGADIVLFFSGDYKHQPWPSTWASAGKNPATNGIDEAAALIRISKANKRYTTAHELSHLLRCQHRKDDGDEGSNFAFKRTIVKWSGIKTIRTTTFGSSAKKIPYHSNPNITLQDIEIGDNEDANNSAMVNSRGCAVSNFIDEGDIFSVSLEHPLIVCGCKRITVNCKIFGSVSNPVQFKLYTSQDAVNFNLLSQSVNPSIAVDVPCHPTKIKAYYMYVEAVDANGNSAKSTTTAVISLPNIHPWCWFRSADDSSSELMNNEIVNVQNPAKDNLYIHFSNEDKRNINLYNSEGILVYQNNAYNEKTLEINIDNYTSGMYFLRVINSMDNKVSIKKIVIE